MNKTIKWRLESITQVKQKISTNHERVRALDQDIRVSGLQGKLRYGYVPLTDKLSQNMEATVMYFELDFVTEFCSSCILECRVNSFAGFYLVEKYDIIHILTPLPVL